jgi:hypothetical protein
MFAGEVYDTGHDVAAEAGAVENPVVAYLGLHVVHSHVIRYVGTYRLRRFRLTQAGNVVILTFDCEQRDVAD